MKKIEDYNFQIYFVTFHSKNSNCGRIFLYKTKSLHKIPRIGKEISTNKEDDIEGVPCSEVRVKISHHFHSFCCIFAGFLYIIIKYQIKFFGWCINKGSMSDSTSCISHPTTPSFIHSWCWQFIIRDMNMIYEHEMEYNYVNMRIPIAHCGTGELSSTSALHIFSCSPLHHNFPSYSVEKKNRKKQTFSRVKNESPV